MREGNFFRYIFYFIPFTFLQGSHLPELMWDSTLNVMRRILGLAVSAKEYVRKARSTANPCRDATVDLLYLI